MSKKRIRLSLSNPDLSALVSEQLELLPGMEFAREGEEDLVLSDHPVDSASPVLLIGRGGQIALPVRLGAILDQVRYLLSGRDKFAAVGVGTIVIGPFLLQAEDSILIHEESGDGIRLTDKERLFILTLYEADNHALDRQALLDKVWGYADGVETHTLETHLYRLRQKLEAYNAADLIVSEDGLYRLKI